MLHHLSNTPEQGALSWAEPTTPRRCSTPGIYATPKAPARFFSETPRETPLYVCPSRLVLHTDEAGRARLASVPADSETTVIEHIHIADVEFTPESVRRVVANQMGFDSDVPSSADASLLSSLMYAPRSRDAAHSARTVLDSSSGLFELPDGSHSSQLPSSSGSQPVLVSSTELSTLTATTQRACGVVENSQESDVPDEECFNYLDEFGKDKVKVQESRKALITEGPESRRMQASLEVHAKHAHFCRAGSRTSLPSAMLLGLGIRSQEWPRICGDTPAVGSFETAKSTSSAACGSGLADDRAHSMETNHPESEGTAKIKVQKTSDLDSAINSRDEKPARRSASISSDEEYKPGREQVDVRKCRRPAIKKKTRVFRGSCSDLANGDAIESYAARLAEAMRLSELNSKPQLTGPIPDSHHALTDAEFCQFAAGRPLDSPKRALLGSYGQLEVLMQLHNRQHGSRTDWAKFIMRRDKKDDPPHQFRSQQMTMLPPSDTARRGTVVCGEGCNFRSSLPELALHMDEQHGPTWRNWICNYKRCVYSVIGFHSRSQARRHFTTAHGFVKPECRLCSRGYTRVDALRRHYRSKHLRPS